MIIIYKRKRWSGTQQETRSSWANFHISDETVLGSFFTYPSGCTYFSWGSLVGSWSRDAPPGVLWVLTDLGNKKWNTQTPPKIYDNTCWSYLISIYLIGTLSCVGSAKLNRTHYHDTVATAAISIHSQIKRHIICSNYQFVACLIQPIEPATRSVGDTS